MLTSKKVTNINILGGRAPSSPPPPPLVKPISITKVDKYEQKRVWKNLAFTRVLTKEVCGDTVF